jgi:hypothetical protein
MAGQLTAPPGRSGKMAARHYITGDTYSLRDQLKAAGCHWDPERRAWWTGKAEVAARFAAKASTSTTPKTETVDPRNTPIIGRAQYKGHEYLLLWEGMTKRGTRAARLAFRDGSRVFWADATEYRVVKRYREPLTLQRLNQLAEEFREQKKAAEPPAPQQIDELLAQIGRVRAADQPTRFERAGKEGPSVGELFTHKTQTFVVVWVSAPFFHSEEECEDMDCFCGRYGWHVAYQAIQVAPTAAEQAAVAEAAARKQRAAEVERLLHTSYGAETNIGPSAPAGVQMTELYGAGRMAGSETWYLGSDGAVYYRRSDYDMGSMWWRTTATPELVREAAELGVRP